MRVPTVSEPRLVAARGNLRHAGCFRTFMDKFERRCAERVEATDLAVTFRWLPARPELSSRILRGPLVDLSLFGLRFAGAPGLRLGTRGRLTIRESASDQALVEVVGIVRWIRLDGGEAAYGVEFDVVELESEAPLRLLVAAATRSRATIPR